jgi:hypothetical protein
MNYNRLFISLAKGLKILRESGIPIREVRDKLVKASDTDDLIFLINVFEDLIAPLHEE